MDIILHNCKAPRITHHQPSNANCIEIEILHKAAPSDGGYSEQFVRITLFDLPTDFTDKLIPILEDLTVGPSDDSEIPF